MSKRKIVFDAERMKYSHTGLYHYCLQLGRALQKEINDAQEELVFYVRPNHKKDFGENAHYIYQHWLHEFYQPLRKASVWHTTYHASNYFPFLQNKKVVLTIHDLNVVHEKSFDDKYQKKELNKIQKKINSAAHIVAISHFTLSDVKRHLTLGNKPVTVIHNGCNIQSIENLLTPALLPNAPFLFTLGAINAKKNFHVLPSLLVGNQKKLLIAGLTDNEEYKQKIIVVAKENGVNERVIFTGPVNENDKQWYMKNCEAFVFPSIAEGFGLPVIEAMYFGKPVIISAHTALPEIGGDVAYYFKDFEPENMRATLQSALQHYNENPSAQNKIRARAAQFTWEDAAKKYLNVYRSLY